MASQNRTDLLSLGWEWRAEELPFSWDPGPVGLGEEEMVGFHH